MSSVSPPSRLPSRIADLQDDRSVVTRPVVVSAPEMGNQMPLRVRRVPPDEIVKAV